MSGTVLDKIVELRRIDVAKMAQEKPLSSFKETLTLSEADRDFYQNITARKAQNLPAYILECKRSSPSKGLIREDFDLAKSRHFGGDFENIAVAKNFTTAPILCKDFVVDAYQIYLARHYGANAVLLMLSVLRDDEYRYLANIAHELGMGVLTEVNDEAEVARALKLQAKVIGVNNRDLRDLSIDLDKTERLRALMPKEQIVISESGIRSYSDIRRISHFADGFLIGSHLMGSDHLERALQELLTGGHKVCGLTSVLDAKAALDAGAMYGGLIFILSSPRGITHHTAADITKEVPLNFIGVFQNDDIESIIYITEKVGLFAVQ